MKSSPAFQFYPHDFLVGTADLTAEEVGGYIRLLCYQWAKGSLPNDEKKLMQLSGISDGLSLGNVSVKFRLCDDGMKRNDRLEKVRIEQEEYRRKQAENGSKGGNPNFQHGKHNPYYKPKDNPLDNPEHNPKINSSSSSSTSPITITNIIKEDDVPSSEFRQLASLWQKRYKDVLGVPYKFSPGKDLAGSKSLASLEGYTPETLVDLAEKAWRNKNGFWSKQAATIAGFSSKFNEIRQEVGGLSKPKKENVAF